MRVQYWVHRGLELDKCTAIHPSPKTMQILHMVLRKIAKNKEKFMLQRHDDGRIKIHGEK